MAASQIHSFVWKFQELAHIGINANLNFNSCNGNVFATFAAELGKPNPPTMVNYAHFYELPKTQTLFHSKKSRIRRRKKRQEERDSALETTESSADNAAVCRLYDKMAPF